MYDEERRRRRMKNVLTLLGAATLVVAGEKPLVIESQGSFFVGV